MTELNSLQKLESMLSNKYSTTFMINSNKSEITHRFLNPIELNPNLNYELGLIYFSTYNSIFNITDKNNKIKVTISKASKTHTSEQSSGDKVTFNIAVYPGAYEIKEISKVIENEIKYSKEFNTPNVDINIKTKPYIKFSPNVVSMNCVLKLEKGCTVLFPKEESFADLLGFEKGKEYKEGINYSTKKVDINNIGRVCIECDIVEGSYEINKKTDLFEKTSVIYDFPTNTVRRGEKILETPKNIIYYPITIKNINQIRFNIRDEDNNLIDFNQEEIMFKIHIKQN